MKTYNLNSLRELPLQKYKIEIAKDRHVYYLKFIPESRSHTTVSLSLYIALPLDSVAPLGRSLALGCRHTLA